MNLAGPKNVVRHETFYFPSGDLVIQSAANLDGKATLYRVSKSLLAFNSPIFATMLSLPGASSQETYCGAPIVHLMDTAEELTSLLSALHDPSFFSYQRYDPKIPERFTPVMRIARKYEIDRICARVAEIMNDNWPQSLEHWRCIQSDISAIMEAHQNAYDGVVRGKVLEERVPEPAAAIRFAREFDMPHILPLAMYTLASISDWDESGTLNGRIARVANWKLLDATDLRHLSRYRRISAEIVHRIFSQYYLDRDLEDFVCGGCHHPDLCEARVEDMVTGWTDPDIGPLRKELLGSKIALPDPLSLYRDLYASHPGWRLCRTCRENLQLKMRADQCTAFNEIQTLASLLK